MGLLTPNILNILPSSEKVYPLSSADTLMVEIKYYLTCTDKTKEEISEDLSFCSTSAFIQYFKSKTGCTPFKYRRDQKLKTQ